MNDLLAQIFRHLQISKEPIPLENYTKSRDLYKHLELTYPNIDLFDYVSKNKFGLGFFQFPHSIEICDVNLEDLKPLHRSDFINDSHYQSGVEEFLWASHAKYYPTSLSTITHLLSKKLDVKNASIDVIHEFLIKNNYPLVEDKDNIYLLSDLNSLYKETPRIQQLIEIVQFYQE